VSLPAHNPGDIHTRDPGDPEHRMQPVDPEGVERLCLLDGVTLQPFEASGVRHWVAGALSETAGSNATSCNKLASRMAA